jgi:MFS family permease
MGLGQACQGFADALILVFILPEMIEVLERQHKGLSEKQKSRLADFSSGLLNSFLGVGQLVGPIYASVASHNVGYRLTCDGVALMALALGVLYLVAARSR